MVIGMEFEMNVAVGSVNLGLRSGASKQSGCWEHVSGHKAAKYVELGVKLPSVHHGSFRAKLSQSTPEATSKHSDCKAAGYLCQCQQRALSVSSKGRR